MPDAALDAEADAAPDNEPATDPHRGEVTAGSRSARLSSPISWALPSALVLVALRQTKGTRVHLEAR